MDTFQNHYTAALIILLLYWLQEYIIESPYAYLNILEIDNINDTNEYTCKATNSLGDASETVTVEVLKGKLLDNLKCIKHVPRTSNIVC